MYGAIQQAAATRHTFFIGPNLLWYYAWYALFCSTICLCNFNSFFCIKYSLSVISIPISTTPSYWIDKSNSHWSRRHRCRSCGVPGLLDGTCPSRYSMGRPSCGRGRAGRVPAARKVAGLGIGEGSGSCWTVLRQLRVKMLHAAVDSVECHSLRWRNSYIIAVGWYY